MDAVWISIRGHVGKYLSEGCNGLQVGGWLPSSTSTGQCGEAVGFGAYRWPQKMTLPCQLRGVMIKDGRPCWSPCNAEHWAIKAKADLHPTLAVPIVPYNFLNYEMCHGNKSIIAPVSPANQTKTDTVPCLLVSKKNLGLLFLIICICVCAHECSVKWGQQRAPDLLKLEVHAVECWESNLRPLEKAVYILNHWTLYSL